jgi:hypothetical protein
MPTSGRFSFTTTHWMVHRIHGNTSYLWPAASPAFSACLAERNIFVFQVSYLTNCCFAVKQKHANFTRGKLDLSIPSLFGHELGISSRTSHYLCPFARLHLNIMDQSAQRYVAHGQSIAGLNVG